MVARRLLMLHCPTFLNPPPITNDLKKGKWRKREVYVNMKNTDKFWYHIKSLGLHHKLTGLALYLSEEMDSKQ